MEFALLIGASLLLTLVGAEATLAPNATLANASLGPNTTSSTDPDASAEPDNALLKLTDTLSQIIFVIAFGYFARRFGFISADAMGGIGQLVGKVALPALLLKAVATADLGSVDFRLIICMECASFCGFLCSIVLASVVKKSRFFHDIEVSKLSLVGAFGLYVTNQDYMAVGVPLITAVFGEEQALYLFILAVMQNILVNPIMFLIMELGIKQEKSGMQTLKSAIFRVITHPLVVSSMVGLIVNLCGGLPSTSLENVLNLLGGAFQCGALITLGMGIVGNTEMLISASCVLPLALVASKSLVVPMVAKNIAESWLTVTDSHFGFVCGTIGTAASTPLMISNFLPHIAGQIRGAAILNLILSIPLLMLSAVLFTMNLDQTKQLLGSMRDISNIGSFLGCFALLLNFAVIPEWRIYPIRVIADLILWGLPFWLGHYRCNATTGTVNDLWYVLTNISRLALRGYMLALTVVLFLLARWDSWFPDVRFTNENAAVQIEALDAKKATTPYSSISWTTVGINFQTRMGSIHMVARCAALLYGIIGTAPFLWLDRDKDQFSCWIRHGDPQWWQELLVGLIIMVAQLTLLVLYRRTPSTENMGHPSVVHSEFMFHLMVLLVIQVVNLLFHFVVELRIISSSPMYFLENETWVQSLILLIITTDAGGMIISIIVGSIGGTIDKYGDLQSQMFSCLYGTKREFDLEAYASGMMGDPRLRRKIKYGKGFFLRDAFSGADACDWLLRYDDVKDREEACTICCAMMQSGLFLGVPAGRCHNFIDASDHYYTINFQSSRILDHTKEVQEAATDFVGLNLPAGSAEHATQILEVVYNAGGITPKVLVSL